MATGDPIKPITFSLSPSEQLKFETWRKEQKEKSSKMIAIGGRYTFMFTPTGLGDIVVIKDNETGDQLNLTDFENW